MASRKRKVKAARQGGYNFRHTDPRLIRRSGRSGRPDPRDPRPAGVPA